jgi:cytochrome c oxidase subunit 2
LQREAGLDPYAFDYLLLCNKICGASHYNMQMKIIVDTPEDYKKKMFQSKKLAQQVNEANAPEAAGVSTSADSLKSKKILRLFRKWL